MGPLIVKIIISSVKCLIYPMSRNGQHTPEHGAEHRRYLVTSLFDVKRSEDTSGYVLMWVFPPAHGINYALVLLQRAIIFRCMHVCHLEAVPQVLCY